MYLKLLGLLSLIVAIAGLNMRLLDNPTGGWFLLGALLLLVGPLRLLRLLWAMFLMMRAFTG